MAKAHAAKGDIFKIRRSAKTLRLISEKGRDAFYKGESRTRSMTSAGERRFFCEKSISKNTAARGSSLSQQIIAAMTFLNCRERPRDRDAPNPEHSEGFDLRAMGRNSPETLHTMN